MAAERAVALGGTAEEFSDWAAAPSGKVEEDGGAAREARVLRYREKKKRRQFGKQIRYESRKACAETRPRVRGRFARAAAAADRPTVSGVGTGGSVRLGWVAPPGMNRGH
ncbi:unnamed protein product [Spirodela intermedia]|uniref:CCT domain-containing protein n=1 Tax=Spirodela intermedia TaxID=51605 RepID=A0A7I8J9B6_SPIIN|nr:unnamed protein product [Spirodela intermedia]CAA6666806.1 unnamed protein product [Spirodela intermedia]